MTSETLSPLLSPLTLALSAPLGAWLGSILLRKRYHEQIEALRAQIDSKRAEIRAAELENTQKATQILLENIVTPLRAEIQILRRDVERFRIAIEQIPRCPYAHECPVEECMRSEIVN